MVERIEYESLRLFRPEVADELVRREAFERLQTPRKIVRRDEVCEMGPQLVMRFIEVSFDGRVLNCGFMRSTCPFVQGCLGLVSR